MNRIIFKYFCLLLLISTLLTSITLNAQSKARESAPNSTYKEYLNKRNSRSNSANSADESYNRNNYSNRNKSAKSGDNDIDTDYRRDYLPEKDELFPPEIVRTPNYFKIEDDNFLWNGKRWLKSRFPLKVFIEDSNSRNYKDFYYDYIEYALEVWENADDRIKFEIISSERDADIKFIFVDNLMKKMRKDYIGYTDYRLKNKTEITSATLEISLLKYEDEHLTDGEIKGVIIHELGHALGLGHSDNRFDYMYPYVPPETSPVMNYNELSTGDIKAIRSVMDLAF